MHALTETNRFATFFWAVYDEKDRQLTWVNAGHNAPMLLRASGALERLPAGGPPLGALPGAVYRQATTALAPGDVLVIFTDGVTEAASPADEEFGEARLEEILRRHAGSPVGSLCQRIVAAVEAFEAGLPQQDDITVVAGAGSDPVGARSLKGDLSRVGLEPGTTSGHTSRALTPSSAAGPARRARARPPAAAARRRTRSRSRATTTASASSRAAGTSSAKRRATSAGGTEAASGPRRRESSRRRAR